MLDFFAQAQQLVGGVFGGAAGLDAAGLAGGVDPVLQRRPADPEVHGDRGERGACGVLIESDRVRLELIGVGVLRPWWFLAFSGPFWSGGSVSTKQGTAP